MEDRSPREIGKDTVITQVEAIISRDKMFKIVTGYGQQR
jgi:hypothetical protein